MRRRAKISSDGKYRYALWRSWDRRLEQVLFVCLNPSKADGKVDDRTVNRCIEFAKAWKFGRLAIVNLFAVRSPKPSVLRTEPDPVGPRNDYWIGRLAERSAFVVVAWGRGGRFKERSTSVLPMLKNPHCLDTNQDDSPRHPLYVAGDTQPRPYRLTNGADEAREG